MEEIGSVKKYRFRNVRDFESLVNNNVNILDNIKQRMHLASNNKHNLISYTTTRYLSSKERIKWS